MLSRSGIIYVHDLKNSAASERIPSVESHQTAPPAAPPPQPKPRHVHLEPEETPEIAMEYIPELVDPTDLGTLPADEPLPYPPPYPNRPKRSPSAQVPRYPFFEDLADLDDDELLPSAYPPPYPPLPQKRTSPFPPPAAPSPYPPMPPRTPNPTRSSMPFPRAQTRPQSWPPMPGGRSSAQLPDFSSFPPPYPPMAPQPRAGSPGLTPRRPNPTHSPLSPYAYPPPATSPRPPRRPPYIPPAVSTRPEEPVDETPKEPTPLKPYFPQGLDDDTPENVDTVSTTSTQQVPAHVEAPVPPATMLKPQFHTAQSEYEQKKYSKTSYGKEEKGHSQTSKSESSAVIPDYVPEGLGTSAPAETSTHTPEPSPYTPTGISPSTAPAKPKSPWKKWLGIGCLLVAGAGSLIPFVRNATFEAQYVTKQATEAVEHVLYTPDPLPPSMPIAFNPLSLANGESIRPVSTTFAIVIPKIGINSLIVPSVDPFTPAAYNAALKQGVAHARTSYFPNQAGSVYLFSHSTNYDWFVKQLNAVFYNVKNLEPGDQIVLVYDNTLYTYAYREKVVVSPKDVTYLLPQNRQQQLILQTCWPPGSVAKRLILYADLIDVRPYTAQVATI